MTDRDREVSDKKKCLLKALRDLSIRLKFILMQVDGWERNTGEKTTKEGRKKELGFSSNTLKCEDLKLEDDF